MTPFSFFAPSPRGLEAILAEELTAIGGQDVYSVPGGVAFSGPYELVYKANLHSRIATRILMQLSEADYRHEEDIYRLANDIDWPAWFSVDRTIKVSVTAIRCPLKSLDFLTLKIKDAVCDRFRADCGSRPSVEIRQPDVRIHAFIQERHIVFYLDTSGEPLYKRTGRPGSHEAPLKENLAAGILALTGWDPQTPLLDPMCGGGTFLIEAAQRTLNIAPGHQRSFGFERLSHFDDTRWQHIKAKAKDAEQPKRLLDIVGADRYGKVLHYARLNIEAAELTECIQLKQANLTELNPPFDSGTVVMNPPYGVRLTDIEDSALFYQTLGDRLKQCYNNFHIWILSAEMQVPQWIRLKPKRRIPLFNGNIECRLFGFEIVSGSFRRQKRSPESSEGVSS